MTCEIILLHVERWIRKMSNLTEVFWESVPNSWFSIEYERLQNCGENKTGGRDRDRYDDERVDPSGWMVRSWQSINQNLCSAPSRSLLRGASDPGQAEKNSLDKVVELRTGTVWEVRM